MLLLTAVLLLFAYWYCFSMPGSSHSGRAAPLSSATEALAASLERHVRAIATTPHNVHYADNLAAAADYLESELRATSLPVRSQIFDADGISVRNIEVVIEPAVVGHGTTNLVVGAHYDSADDAPGANDNATGAAAVVEIAKRLASLKPEAIRIRFVLFVNEEPPYFQTELMGSLVYARELKQRGEPVRAMLCLETLGFYSDAPDSQAYPWPLGLILPTTANFVSFIGTLPNRSLVRRSIDSFRRQSDMPSEGAALPASIPRVTWSDHWSFGEVGYPAIMVTDTALFRYRHYHTPDDTPDKVDYARLARVTEGLAAVVVDLATNP